MNRLSKERRRAIINECAKDKPDFHSIRKIVYHLMIGLVVFRILLFNMGFIYGMTHKIFTNPFSIAMLIFPVPLTLIFAFAIYSSGLRNFAFLLLFGGAISIYNVIKDDLFYAFTSADTLYQFYAVLLIVTVLYQTGSSIFLLVNKKCKVFFSIMADVQVELIKVIKAEQEQQGKTENSNRA